jgi:hypothetical protein
VEERLYRQWKKPAAAKRPRGDTGADLTNKAAHAQAGSVFDYPRVANPQQVSKLRLSGLQVEFAI